MRTRRETDSRMLERIVSAAIMAIGALVIGGPSLSGAESAVEDGKHKPAVTRDFSDLKKNEWLTRNTEFKIQVYKGKKVLCLDGNLALAYIKDLQFADGTIEMDMASSTKARMYFGVAFRIREEFSRKIKARDNSKQKYEYIYFRPFASGTIEAMQYCAAGTEYNWSYLRKKFPGVYEAKVDLPATDWFHVKIEVSGQKAKVYINNAKTPVLVVKDLKHGKTKGSVGFYSYWKPTYFANLKITTSESDKSGVGAKGAAEKKPGK
jgi:3-keto-disaccharide hydrolase